MTGPAPAWGTPPPTTTRYTVIGFHGANGQRFCFHVIAATPRDAEDLIRSDLSSQYSEPQVCGVLAVVGGHIEAVDSYATYLDPDEPA